MKLSTHYYVLSLSENTNRLYEAFRGSLIDIDNTWFPYKSSKTSTQPPLDDVQLRALLQTVDHHFSHYYKQEPLGMIVSGTERSQVAFALVTSYPGVIIGRVEGDHSATSLRDLGNIVWPIVKGVMAGAGRKLQRDLEEATLADNIAFGIDSVMESVDAGVGATLLVEDGYSVAPVGDRALLDDGDNLVDVVIDKVLALGGNVVFVEDGSLAKFQRIGLILRAPISEPPPEKSPVLNPA